MIARSTTHPARSESGTDDQNQSPRGCGRFPARQCGYCMPCPNGVNIQRILDIYNKSVAFANPAEAKRLYGFLKESERAGKCTECLECEGKCPQEVSVHEWLSRIDLRTAPIRS